MAKQTRKIKQKLKPHETETEKPQEKKKGRDYVLLFVILLTIFLGAAGWTSFDIVNRAMYVMLALSLGLSYVQRQASLSENRMRLVSRAGIATMVLAIILFAISVYRQYFLN